MDLLIKIEDLKTHVQNILDGSFSLSGIPDIAFFEERLKLLKLFKPYSYKGIPDIRIIVYNKVPVMAMLRLPTRESDGKANLQQGAIGAGIDMATGVTTTAVFGKGKIIEYIPKTRLDSLRNKNSLLEKYSAYGCSRASYLAPWFSWALISRLTATAGLFFWNLMPAQDFRSKLPTLTDFSADCAESRDLR